MGNSLSCYFFQCILILTTCYQFSLSVHSVLMKQSGGNTALAIQVYIHNTMTMYI